MMSERTGESAETLTRCTMFFRRSYLSKVPESMRRASIRLTGRQDLTAFE